MTKSNDPIKHAMSIGYTQAEMGCVPEGLVAHGCGNPTALTELKEGETVLDLGSGGGLDAFLAAGRVGSTGRVIGIDKSAEMVATATENAARGNYSNVLFKVGLMEQLPLASESVDLAISNCVINHATDKLAVFRELFRCLKSGGRIMITDLVAEGPFSQAALDDEIWGEWLSHASGTQEYVDAIQAAGFENVSVVAKVRFPMAEADERLRGRITSIAVKACKGAAADKADQDRATSPR
jgi:arsenite methyltransferase